MADQYYRIAADYRQKGVTVGNKVLQMDGTWAEPGTFDAVFHTIDSARTYWQVRKEGVLQAHIRGPRGGQYSLKEML